MLLCFFSPTFSPLPPSLSIYTKDRYQALTWPPPDPSYVPSRPRRLVEDRTTKSSHGFVYGRDILNPALQPTSSRYCPGSETRQDLLRSREGHASSASIRADDGWSDEDRVEEQRWQEGDDDDDMPLGLKIRRGSEGYEVRPRTYVSATTDWDWELERDDLVRRYEARRV